MEAAAFFCSQKLCQSFKLCLKITCPNGSGSLFLLTKPLSKF